MEDIFALLRSLPEGGLEAMVLVLSFLATALLVWGGLSLLTAGGSPVERRLKSFATEAGLGDKKEHHQEGGFEVRWLEPAMKLALPVDGWKRSEVRTQLVQAGIRNPKSLQYYFGLKLLLALGLPIFSLIPLLLLGYLGGIERTILIFLLAVFALVGFYLPDYVVYRRKARRQLEFSEGFPDAMDMLVVCVEAGLGLDAAIQRVGDEIAVAHPELAIEFQLVSLELRAGKSREDALRALAQRTGIEEVQALVTLLIQAEHFGTSIAGALRTYANEMRSQRIDRAREKAAKLPVKLIFPIALFIFPALFLVVLGPAIVSIYKAFTGVGLIS